VEGCGALAMPGGCTEGVFEIAIKSLNVPAHVIEAGQLGSGIKNGIQQGVSIGRKSVPISGNEKCTTPQGVGVRLFG
jgi:hypothetical protein